MSMSMGGSGMLPLSPASGAQGRAPWTSFGHHKQSTLARPRPADFICRMDTGFNIRATRSKAPLTLYQVSRLRTAASKTCSKDRRRHTDSGYQSGFKQREDCRFSRKGDYTNSPNIPGFPARSYQDRETWQIQKYALSKKFGGSKWLPRKRLSPDSLEGIRTLHAEFPDTYTTPALANLFEISPEAIRRILKSKWRPSDIEEERRRARWNKRGLSIWGQLSELGLKAPKKWRIQERGPDDAGDGLQGQTTQQEVVDTRRDPDLAAKEQSLHSIKTTLRFDTNLGKGMSLVDRL